MELNWGTDWGLTDKGYLKPTYDEILYSVEQDFLSRFGPDIVLTSNSNFGILARLIAWREYNLLSEVQEVYFSPFVSTATGTSLDRLGANSGVPRKLAQPSHAEVIIVTDGEYSLQAGEQFETPDGIMFDLIEDVTTTQQSDGTWSGVGKLESVEKGAINNVNANSITIESNPDENVISVTNPSAATGGQDYETDDIYRARLRMENADRPSPTREGIKSALLALPGVCEVYIVENPTDKTDKYGNPPESVHVYTLGGNPKDIGEALVSHRAAGTRFFGKHLVEVYSPSGETEEVYFDYATPKPIFAHVSVTTNDEFNQDSGVTDIKNAIADQINAMEMGVDVKTTKLYTYIYKIAGVEDVKLEIGTSKDNLSENNVPVDVFEAPTCNTSDIQVTVNGV